MTEQIKTVSGKIHIVKDISFSDLAIIHSSENICLLKCPKFLKKDLLNNEGKKVIVK